MQMIAHQRTSLNRCTMDEDNAFSPNIRNSMTYLKKKLKRSENERRYSMPRTAMKNKESEFHNHLSSVFEQNERLYAREWKIEINHKAKKMKKYNNWKKKSRN
eukprot:UN03615